MQNAASDSETFSGDLHNLAKHTSGKPERRLQTCATLAPDHAGFYPVLPSSVATMRDMSPELGKVSKSQLLRRFLLKFKELMERKNLLQFVASITAAAERIRKEFGRLDLLVNNAAISNTTKQPGMSIAEYAKLTRPSNVSLDEVRAVWETNVFGILAVYQAMLPLLRESSAGRVVNVSSSIGSLVDNATAGFAYRAIFGPVYPASKAALNAITLAMMIELESTGINVNLVSPGFTKTNLNGYAGTESLEDGSREVVRAALLGPDGPTGTFTRWENVTIPW